MLSCELEKSANRIARKFICTAPMFSGGTISHLFLVSQLFLHGEGADQDKRLVDHIIL